MNKSGPLALHLRFLQVLAKAYSQANHEFQSTISRYVCIFNHPLYSISLNLYSKQGIDLEELTTCLESLDGDDLRSVYDIFSKFDTRDMSIVELKGRFQYALCYMMLT